MTARIANDTASQPVVLYPGDEWVVGEPYSSDAAVARYQSEFDTLAERELVKADEVSIEDLLQSGVNFCNRWPRNRREASAEAQRGQVVVPPADARRFGIPRQAGCNRRAAISQSENRVCLRT